MRRSAYGRLLTEDPGQYQSGLTTGREKRFPARFYAQGRTDEIVAYATCAPRASREKTFPTRFYCTFLFM